MNRDFPSRPFDSQRSVHSRSRSKFGLSPSYRGPQSPSHRPLSRTSSIRSNLNSNSTESSYNIQLLLSDGQVFPQDVLLLLGDQQRNLGSFKNRIQNQKIKVENDFTSVKMEICHIVDDLKISVQAELDNIYRLFMEKYACLKSEVQDIRRIKKEIQWQSPSQNIAPTSLSNRQLVKELEQDCINYKTYKIHNYITEIQKKKLSPLLDLTREIVLLGTTNSTFYKSDVTIKQLTELKNSFGHFTSHMFAGLANYVAGPQAVMEKMDNYQKGEDKDNTMRRDEDFQYPTKDYLPRSITTPVPPVASSEQIGGNPGRSATYSEYMPHQSPNPYATMSPRHNQYQLFPPTDPGFSKSSHSIPNITVTPVSPTPNFQTSGSMNHVINSSMNSYMTPNMNANFNSSSNSNTRIRLSSSGQSISSSWAEDIKVTQSKTIYTDHQNIILCAAIIKNQYIATGGKDSLINVYTFQGSKVATLRGHNASICTISVLNPRDAKPIMVSGGDIKCNTIVLWDTSTWTIRSKIQAHNAAVTALVDCGDGQTMISGSFDKKINVINYNRAEVMFNLPINKQSVMGITLNSTKTKMISASITETESSLSIWNIIKRSDVNSQVMQNGVVEMVSLQKVIPNGNRIWSLIGSQIRSTLVVTGSQDGKVKLWNIETGECQKILTVNNNAIVELALIERDSKPNFPLILSCSAKDKSLVLTRTETSINSLFEVNNKLCMTLGCGVTPKIIFDKYRGLPIMALVNQSEDRREVVVFDVDIK